MQLETDRLHIGDNLDILRRYVADESVDLVYLDPPFKSNRAYHLIFRDESGRTSDAQQLAFDDSWHWGPTAETHFLALAMPSGAAAAPAQLSAIVTSFVEAIGRNELTAYLVEMAVRLVELHRVLRPTGSLFLHCDPTASHYLKLMLDALFGPLNFRNEIIWKRTNAHNDAKRFGRIHDVILFYAKSPGATWNRTYQPYDPEYAKRYYRYSDPDGRRWKSGDVTAPGNRGPAYEWNGHLRHWRFTRKNMEALDAAGRLYYTARGIPRLKQYLDEMPGMPAQDIWADGGTRYIVSWSDEGLGYPTQKPVGLVKRIIEASSNAGDVVLDPFCGCGTAIEAAIETGRRWIGIDVSDQAYQVIEQRFLDRYGRSVPLGHIAPRDVATAQTLATTRPHGRRDFEAWAINLVGARRNTGPDRGVDGIIPFVNQRGRVQRALVSVKSGKVKPADVRDLKGTVSRERAAVGLLVTLEEPSSEMLLEATSAGFYGPGIPRLQILTIAEALGGSRPRIPRYQQQELFAEVPDAGSESSLPGLLEELESQIETARGERAKRSRRELERIRDSVRRVLEEEEREDRGGRAAARRRASVRAR